MLQLNTYVSVNCHFFRYELDLRMVSTEDNFLQDGNGQESFLCLVSSRSELTALTQRKRSCAFLFWKKGRKKGKKERFLKWKPAFKWMKFVLSWKTQLQLQVPIWLSKGCHEKTELVHLQYFESNFHFYGTDVLLSS